MSNDIHYMEHGPDGRQCWNCTHFTQDSTILDKGDCMGHKVSSAANCNLFKPKKNITTPNYCPSCAGNLNDPGISDNPSHRYCKHCTYSDGTLKSREDAIKEIASWFEYWQKNVTPAQALQRAEHYIKAMPAWAED